MVLTDEQIINRLAEKAAELHVDLEGSSVSYLNKIMDLAGVCNFSTDSLADQFFTGALERGLANGSVKHLRNVGTA